MSKLIDMIHEDLPKFNPIIAEGVAVSQLESAESFIDYAFKLSAHSFPPGLKYEGYERCTVDEEFDIISKRKNQQHTLELAASDVYLVNYLFSYNGEKLPPRPLFIPFVGKAGMMRIRGKLFTVQPVLADETLSVAKGDIFVPFLAAKITFKKQQYLFRINGQQRTQYLVYSKIYNQDVKNQPRRSTRADNSVSADSTIPHYLFCKFGFKGTFQRYCNGLEPIVMYANQYNPNEWPEDQWTVCSSNRVKPRSVRNKNYVPSDIIVIIPKSMETNLVIGLLTGFFYVLDHYPERFSLEVFDGTEDEIRLWRSILGHTIFRNRDSEGKLYIKVNEHMVSLDQYLDDMTKDGLETQGYQVDDLYDLMAILVASFNDIVFNANVASMYGKMLAVNRYLLQDIIRAISVFKFKFLNTTRALTKEDINKMLAKYLKPETFFSNQAKHNEITSTQCPGDNMMFSYTTRLILQENATGTSKKGSISFKDPSKQLDASLAEAGSILALPKQEPTGKIVLNPFLMLTRSFKIRQSPELKPVIDYIRKEIKRS